MENMVRFVESGTQGARAMYGVLEKAEKWYKAFPDSDEGKQIRADKIRSGVDAFFWHITNIGVEPEGDELREVGVSAVHEIIAENPAVLYIAMEQLCNLSGEEAANEVMANFGEEWEEMTGEKELGKGYSKEKAVKRLQTARNLFGFNTLH